MLYILCMDRLGSMDNNPDYKEVVDESLRIRAIVSDPAKSNGNPFAGEAEAIIRGRYVHRLTEMVTEPGFNVYAGPESTKLIEQIESGQKVERPKGRWANDAFAGLLQEYRLTPDEREQVQELFFAPQEKQKDQK